MTLFIANKPASSFASSKFINSLLGGFKDKLKSYIARGSTKERQGNTFPLVEEADPKKLELEAMKNIAYSGFSDHIYYFLSGNPAFSIKYFNSFKERALKEKGSLFSHNENMEMLFLIELVNEIRRLKQKLSKNKRYDDEYTKAHIDEMTYKLYNNLPENVFYCLEADRIESEINAIEQTAKAYYPDDLEAQESYLRLHGFA